jgi:hypothetical protein
MIDLATGLSTSGVEGLQSGDEGPLAHDPPASEPAGDTLDPTAFAGLADHAMAQKRATLDKAC